MQNWRSCVFQNLGPPDSDKPSWSDTRRSDRVIGPHALLRENAATTRVMVVAAHPDDETLGAGCLLAHVAERRVVVATQGAPRDLRFAPAAQGIGRNAYADQRWAELRAALATAGLQPRDLIGLGLDDLEVSLNLLPLIHHLVGQLDGYRPHLLVSHGYKGGHPDHDAVAFAVQTAVALLTRDRAIDVHHAQMALYHGVAGHLVAGRFVADPFSARRCGDEGEITTARHLAVKHRMLACFKSQRAVLCDLQPHGPDRFRPAPQHDFSRPPHAGLTWYQRIGMPMTPIGFCALAAAARTAVRI